MWRYVILISVVVGLGSAIAATNRALKASLDISVFKYDAEQLYTEVYYAIPTSNLTFVPTRDVLSAEVAIQLTIEKNGEPWREEAWRLAKEVADSSSLAEDENMLDVLNYLMPPGDYLLTFSLNDVNVEGKILDIKKELHLDLFDAESIAMSDIELATSIKRSPEDSVTVFVKNDLEILPNPSSVFSSATPMVYYYVEAYNLDASISSGSYMTRCAVTDINAQPLSAIKPRVQKKKLIESCVEVGAVRVVDLPSGRYNLEFSIMDMEENVVSHRTKTFFVYNPDNDSSRDQLPGGISDAAIEASEFNGMSSEQLDEEYGMIQYISQPEEVVNYKQMDNVHAKRRYLYEFWVRMDPIPATVINELRVAFMNKIDFANETFRTFNRAGWKTDRGRVYILYGQPSDIERYPNNATSYSYQVWHYDQIEGGIEFVFVDFQEFGEYMQLHSTKRGEPQNKQWERVISKN